MNKAAFISKMAADAKISKAAAAKALDSFIEGVKGALKKGERATLIGLGSFSVSHRKARTGRNPQTGKAMKIAAKKVPRFAAGAALKEAVRK